MDLLLIRHALPLRVEEADGPADPELSDAGHLQARHLAEYLSDEPITTVYASPLRRAHQTAMPIAAALGVEVRLDGRVAEYDRHSASYIPVEQLKAENHPDWQAMLAGSWHADLGIDPIEFRATVVAAIESLVAAHPGQTIAIVCHGGVINAYLSHILGLDDPMGFFYPNYTSVHRIVAARSGERSIRTLNETFHLRGTGLPVGLFDS